MAFLPFHVIVKAAIPWSEFRGSRARTAGSKLENYHESLDIVTTRTTYVIGWDVFAKSVSDLAEAIDAYSHRISEHSLLSSTTRTRIQQLRFSRTLRIESVPRKAHWLEYGLVPFFLLMYGLGGTIAALGVLNAIGFLGLQMESRDLTKEVLDFAYRESIGDLPLFVLIGFGLGVLIGLWRPLASFNQERQSRVLELRAEGFAFGPKTDLMQPISWDDIQYVGLFEERTHRTDNATSTTTQLKIIRRDQSKMTLQNIYPRSLEELIELIFPPAHKLAAVNHRLESGVSIEQACADKKLPTARFDGAANDD